MSSAAPLIEIEGLCKYFETGEAKIEVLDGIDLRIEAGERIAIVGQSGVGKSTLLHILGSLDRPSAGRMSFRGEDVFSRDSQQLARFRNESIGFVFQFHHLLPEFTSLENTMMPGLVQGRDPAEMRELAERILDEVGLSARLDHPIGKLSGGERQRVALARALVLEPPLVLADEPTGNLDPATGDQVAQLLLDMNRDHGTTLVVVTHSARMAGRLGRTLSLVDGGLREGAPNGALA